MTEGRGREEGRDGGRTNGVREEEREEGVREGGNERGKRERGSEKKQLQYLQFESATNLPRATTPERHSVTDVQEEGGRHGGRGSR